MGRTWLENHRISRENEGKGAGKRNKRDWRLRCTLAAFLLCAGLLMSGCSGGTGSQASGAADADQSQEADQTANADQSREADQTANADQSQKAGQAASEAPSASENGGSGQDSASVPDTDDFQVGMPVRKGVTAPDFTAGLIDGSSVTLSELQGKPVLINFWATWCGPCVREMPAFERLKEDFGDQIEILAVNSGDDAETVKDFAEKNGYTFPIALDETYEISMLYPSSSIPYTVVVDAEGKVSHVSAGAADADTMYDVYKEALGL